LIKAGEKETIYGDIIGLIWYNAFFDLDIGKINQNKKFWLSAQMETKSFLASALSISQPLVAI